MQSRARQVNYCAQDAPPCAQAMRELEPTQARYDNERAWQQYNAVDPANRLVAREPERRWNETLLRVAGLE
jgi:hypothetical protein